MTARRWRKLGRIDLGEFPWSWADPAQGVLTPQPFLVDPAVIRLYGGVRDDHGRSRIVSWDLAANDPTRVVRTNPAVVLDLGDPGMFDDSGVILGDVVRVGPDVRMYYVGFELPPGAKFRAFSGLATSKDGGASFERIGQAPVLDRCHAHPFIRAIHSVIHDGDVFRVWYAVDDGWETIDGRAYPRYHICYCDSDDGRTFHRAAEQPCLFPMGDEYRIGRPRVTRRSNGEFEMFFSMDNRAKVYASGMATSKNGIDWVRDDRNLGIGPSEEGWDSEMICYPVTLDVDGATYCFYSGNGCGASGVGVAVAEHS